jgi:tetratricopeptide (TPR) repeat protein
MVSSLELTQLNTARSKVTQEAMIKSSELLEEGKQYLLEKKYKEAIKSFTQSMKFNKNNLDAKFYRGISFLDSNSTKRAITVSQHILNFRNLMKFLIKHQIIRRQCTLSFP